MCKKAPSIFMCTRLWQHGSRSFNSVKIRPGWGKCFCLESLGMTWRGIPCFLQNKPYLKISPFGCYHNDGHYHAGYASPFSCSLATLAAGKARICQLALAFLMSIFQSWLFSVGLFWGKHDIYLEFRCAHHVPQISSQNLCALAICIFIRYLQVFSTGKINQKKKVVGSQ